MYLGQLCLSNGVLCFLIHKRYVRSIKRYCFVRKHAEIPVQLEIFILQYIIIGGRGGTVVKVLCYKSEGRWFDPSWCHWNFSLT